MTDRKTLRMVARAYQRGATARELAAEHGVHEHTIRAWLDRAGIVDRRRTGPPDAPVPDEVIAELMRTGASWQEIAEQVGMSRSGVRSRARRIQGLPHWR